MSYSLNARRLPLHTRVVIAVFTPLARLMRVLGYRPFAERCSWCHTDLPAGTAFYIEGRRVCGACAELGRRRLLRAAWACVTLTVLLILGAGFGVVLSFRRGDPDAWTALPMMVVIALAPLGFLWFVLRMMKAANRRADELEQALFLHKTVHSL